MIGVSQNQNCRQMLNNWLMLWKNMLSILRIIFSFVVNSIWIVSSGISVSNVVFGRCLLRVRKLRNKVRMMVKLILVLSSMMIGRQMCGKLIFFSRLVFLMNMFWLCEVIFVNRFQVSRLVQRQMLQVRLLLIFGRCVCIIWEKIIVQMMIIDSGLSIVYNVLNSDLWQCDWNLCLMLLRMKL